MSMVNNPPRMHKFLSPTFACIRSRMYTFMSLTESVFTNQVTTFPVQEESRVKSPQQNTKTFSLATIPHQGDGPTNCTAVILRCYKSCFFKITFPFCDDYHYYIFTHIYIHRKHFIKPFCLKAFM